MAAPARQYLMGEKVQLGKLIYTVFETQWLTHLGDAATGRVPQNRFFLVRFSAVNSGSNDVTVPTLTIQDDQGQVLRRNPQRRRRAAVGGIPAQRQAGRLRAGQCLLRRPSGALQAEALGRDRHQERIDRHSAFLRRRDTRSARCPESKK